MNGDAEPTDFLLDRGEDCNDGRQGVLVLRHQSPDVLDVSPRAIVVASVRLDVLQPHVEDSKGSLDGVQLRNRQELDLGGATDAGRGRLRAERSKRRRRR